MPGLGQVLRRLGKFGREEQLVRILDAVNHALLQRSEYFGERHGGWRRTNALPIGYMHRYLHGAQLRALHAIRGLDCAVDHRKISKTIFAPPQRDQAAVFKTGEHLVPKVAIEHLISGFCVFEDERKVEYLK